MDDLLQEFLTETNEGLELADIELVKFEQDPNNAQILNNIFRLVHTIKGTCGFIGLTRLAALAHAAETLMDKFRQGRPVTSEAVGLILSTVDRIKMLLAELQQSGGREPQGSDQDLIDSLEMLASGEAAPAPVAVKAAPQRLERDLLPGEVPLDELERLFQETDVELAVAPAVEVSRPVAPAAPAASSEPEKSKAAPAKAAAAPSRNDEAQVSVATQSIRVNVGVLEQLMTMVSELVLTRNQLLETARRQENSEYKVSLQRLSNVTGELQGAVMRARMQPIGTAWQKLPRIVRDLAHDLGKQIELEQIGGDTELDRQVLDQIKDPLTHMVRNSADHGLEMPDVRRAGGKPEKGSIRLSAYHEGGYVIVEIADDGRGLNIDRIKTKVLESGLATEAQLAVMTEGQVYRYIFHPGLSTAEKVTNVSGRGVGLDVVRSNIDAIGGTVEVRSKAGQGTTFIIKIPLTLAIVPALIVGADGERFALPQSAVVELVRVQPGSDHAIKWLNDAPVLCLRDKLLPILSLGKLLGLSDDSAEARRNDALIVVMQVDHQTFGIVVDTVSHTEEIVVKPLASALRQIPMVSGCTILGDGRVIMILDPVGLAEKAIVGDGEIADEAARAEEEAARHRSQERTSLLLFRAGADVPKSVPLALVTRIEELDVSRIEKVKGRPVIQYRGALIPVIYANESVKRADSGTQPMLIFADGDRVMGLVVDKIVDIVDSPLDMELSPSEAPDLLGVAVIGGQATEVLVGSPYLGLAFEKCFAQIERAEHRPKLLLVQDNAFQRDLLAPMLRGNGYDVAACRTANEALARLHDGAGFDAIVSDIELPGMDGFALAAAVRGDPRSENVPIIAISNVRDQRLIEQGRAVGFTDYVAKFDRAGLIAALKEFAGHQEIAA